jgi:iron complex transport system substrate-binding protein
MKLVLKTLQFLAVLLLFTQCKEHSQRAIPTLSRNEIKYAKGLSIEKHNGFSIVKISNPWPNANKDFIYILKEKNGIVPDSLQHFTTISVPIRTIVVTSTTHIPSLEMLGVEQSLVGFPHLDYISSAKVKQQIAAGKIKELGNNHDLNTEVLLALAPDLIIGYGIDNNNPTLDNIQKSGLKVMLNGDWNEETPLGKAEWIKFFGALYGLEAKSNSIFNSIESAYNQTMVLAKQAKVKPTIFAGALYEDHWFMPKGNSWGCYFINDASGYYLWKDTQGSGSLSLPFETVLQKAKFADIWIGPGQFTSLKEMAETNNHYTQFKAFQDKEVYSFSNKKGATGGVLYYELAPNRPDLVLKDLVKIFHPDLLPGYSLFFFEKLK